MASYRELKEQALEYIKAHLPYERCYWDKFDYSILKMIVPTHRKRKMREAKSYSDIYMMLDTETSKHHKTVYETDPKGKRVAIAQDNHIVTWSLSMRIMQHNLVTLVGRKPSEAMDCIQMIRDNLKSDFFTIYIHFLSFDWTFLRRFFFRSFGQPIYQLNTKPHYPIIIQFDNGLIIRDSLILAQRKLEKWANDLEVEHRKAVGNWDYDKIRDQSTLITDDEWTYQEYDTLSGVECLEATALKLNRDSYNLPLTATAINRGDLVRLGGIQAHNKLVEGDGGYKLYLRKEDTYHGGYTHGNRHYIGITIYGDTEPKDFASSYPFSLFKLYPQGGWKPIKNMLPEDILRQNKDFGFMFVLRAVGVDIKEGVQMPALQCSKCYRMHNPVVDNGRILSADYVEIPLCDVDLEYIIPQYNFQYVLCYDVVYAPKTYLPKWYTDYVFNCFKDKTLAKGGDPVEYSIKKARTNANYGLACQKALRDNILECYEDEQIGDTDYISGDFHIEENRTEEAYQAYLEKYSTILPYEIGIYCTAYATAALHRLGAMCDLWLYSDTDSVYGQGWHEEEVAAYNQECIEFMKMRGYGGVEHNGRMYYLGVAEGDASEAYSEFRVLGAKRYCGRLKADGQLHITVAGVPKKTGAACLKDNIENFRQGFIFDGETTGKMQHTYVQHEIAIDDRGNEFADSVDLVKCDYTLDQTGIEEIRNWIEEGAEIGIQTYDLTEGVITDGIR